MPSTEGFSMITKTCKKCETDLPIDTGFYANDNTCKECRKARVRANRAAKVEYYREYDRKRFKQDPRVSERHRRYRSTEAGKAAANRAAARFIERNTVKRAAHIIVGNAVRDGKLSKPDFCEDCQSRCEHLHGHHDDYAQPLVVHWLCPACHKKWHDENGEGANAR